jgi:putative flippase GtrA
MTVAILIPAYQPSQELVSLVGQLTASCDAPIIVVDDGGGSGFAGIFEKIGPLPRIEVLHHLVNRGKGAALKTGMSHIAAKYPGSVGVVTVDADGQHRSADVMQVAAQLEATPNCLVMGVRAFSGQVPPRSRIGNSITRVLLRIFCGVGLSDTQTGLRGIPLKMIPDLVKVSSLGYEFELDMLLVSKDQNRRIIEVPIATVYLENNASSHFNPFIDSLKIYFVLFRFSLASLSSTLLDFVVFTLVTLLGGSILTALILARAVAVNLNYFLVRNTVFHSALGHRKTLPRYLTLVLVSASVTYFLIRWITSTLSVSAIPAKAIAESLLFFFNFAIQREVIFRQREGAKP